MPEYFYIFLIMRLEGTFIKKFCENPWRIKKDMEKKVKSDHSFLEHPLFKKFL
jgi:hypothetical protein